MITMKTATWSYQTVIIYGYTVLKKLTSHGVLSGQLQVDQKTPFRYTIQTLTDKELTMSQLTIQDVNSAIMYGSFTNDQLSSIGDAIRYRRAQIGKETKRSLMPGDVVKFTNPKTGRTHQGNVVKIKIKNVQVREGLVTWNVPANMLTIA
jgi:hypothetical protein